MGIEDERNNDNLNASGPRQYMELREVTMSQEGLQGTTETETSPYLEINDYAPLHPGTRSWEVPREAVVIEKVMGKGAFGEVAQGRASQLRGREVVGAVAVKMLKGTLLSLLHQSMLEIQTSLYRYVHVVAKDIRLLILKKSLENKILVLMHQK